MTNLERLDVIIQATDNFRVQLIVEGYSQWADKVAIALEEFMWLYREMSEFES